MDLADPVAVSALAEARAASILDLTIELVRIDSQTPPSATGPAADRAAAFLSSIPGVDVRIAESVLPVVNLVAELDGGLPGRRLILSGHLDTYPVGLLSEWSRNPLGAEVEGGRLYGRGSADMKGGVAVMMEVFRIMAEHRPFPGSIVLALAGDEERMGELGTQWLLDHDPAVRGDAVLVADVGGPRAIRLGEKGMVWLDIHVQGRSAHGAHVHNGENAADRLLDALMALRSLEAMKPSPPEDAIQVITEAAAMPHADGPTARATMQRVTVNLGEMQAGFSPNLVPSQGSAGLDIRLPLGIGVATAEAAVEACLHGKPGLSWTVTRRYEPTWTPIDSPIAQAALEGAGRALGKPVWADMRIGGSDARLWRRAGMPCVVLGLSPYNLGGPDEYLEVSELTELARVYLMTVNAFLRGHLDAG